MKFSFPPSLRSFLVTSPILLTATLASSDFNFNLIFSDGTQEQVCTKTQAQCDKAREAIADGRWNLNLTVPPNLLPVTTTSCLPAPIIPPCFTPASNCIQGYNCGK